MSRGHVDSGQRLDKLGPNSSPVLYQARAGRMPPALLGECIPRTVIEGSPNRLQLATSTVRLSTRWELAADSGEALLVI